MRWRMLGLLATARLALGFQFQALGSTGEYLRIEFDLDYSQVGTLIGLFMLPGLVFAIPAGLSERWFSDRALTAVGLSALGMGGILIAMSDGHTQVVWGRVICGFGFVLSTLYFAKMVADWFDGREIATAMSILVMTWPLGIAIGQTTHEWLAINQGWRFAFWIASAYAMVAMILVVVMYQPPATANAQTGPTGRGRSATISAAARGLSPTEWLLTAVAATAWALFNAGYVVYLSFAPQVLVGNGMTPLAAAAVISLASYLMLLSGVTGGFLADRTGRPHLVTSFCLGVGIIALLMLIHPAYALTSSVLFGLVGVAPAGIIMALSAQAMRPENRAFGMGVFFSIYFLLVAPAPAIAGWLFDLSGNAFYPVLFAVLLFILTIVSYWTFRYLRARTVLT